MCKKSVIPLFILKSWEASKHPRDEKGRFDHVNGAMPEPTETTDAPLPEGQSERFYLDAFMKEFGARWDETVQVTDKFPYRRIVSKDLFTDHKTGGFKILREHRAEYVKFIAQAIKNPDEAWVDQGGHHDKTLYCLASYLIKGRVLHIVTAFKERSSKRGADSVWLGWSGYQTKDTTYFLGKRKGECVYRRP